MFCPAVGLNPLDPIYHVSSVFPSKYILQMTLHTSVAVTDVIFASKIDVIARALTNCEFVARYNSISIGYKGKVCQQRMNLYKNITMYLKGRAISIN